MATKETKPKAKTTKKAAPKPEAEAPPAKPKQKQFTRDELAKMGRMLRIGKQSKADVLAAHDQYLKQPDADVKWAKAHKAVLEALPLK